MAEFSVVDFGTIWFNTTLRHTNTLYGYTITRTHSGGRVGVRAASQAQLEGFGLVVVKVFPVFDAKVASSTS